MLKTRSVLKENDLYLVGDGQHRVAEGESGFYRRDTRYLRLYFWQLDGEDPHHLMQHERYPFWLHEHAANAEVGYTMKVGLARDLTVTATEVCDRLTLTRYGPEQAHRLTLCVAGDFQDMFEVRGWPGALGEREVRVEAGPSPDAVTWLEFRHIALDGLRQCARLEFSAPARWDGERLSWVVTEAQAELTVRTFLLQGDEAPVRGDPQALAREYDGLHADLNAALTPGDRRVVERSVHDLRSLAFQTEQGLFPAAGLPWFVAPFGRDSLIIAHLVRDFFPELALTVVRFLAAHQGRNYDPQTLEEPGKILHEVRTGELTRLGRTPHRPYYATCDATPLFVWLIGELSGRFPALAAELRPHWEAALGWMLTDGDPDRDGFIEYTPQAGGMTNAVWKDSGDSTFDERGVDASGHIATVEVQGYAYAAYRAAAGLYRSLGEPEQGGEWDERAQRLQARFQETFWWPERSYYYHGLNGDKSPLRVLVSNPAHALWTGIIPASHAPEVARVALGDELWSGWGIRTLGTGEPRYNPVSYHNGSVWPHDTALAALGLARSGLRREARQVARALFDGALAAPDQRLSELFAGFPREPHTPPVPYPAACHPQGWDAAIPLALAALVAEVGEGEPQDFAPFAAFESQGA